MTQGPTSDPGPDLESDGVPPEAVAAAKDAYATKVDGDIAALTYDSLLDGTGTPAEHVLRFEHSRVEIRVRVASGDCGFTLEGFVRGDSPVEVVLHINQAVDVSVSPADRDSFRFVCVPHGQLRLELRFGAGRTTVWTDWFLL